MMTHDELVQRAGIWLKNTKRCRPVLLEKSTMFSIEIPDAIGFVPGTGTTILIECKATKGDFSSDRSKVFRRNLQMGMGTKRYFMVDKDFEIPGLFPENWGLLRVWPKRVRVIKKSSVFVSAKNAEIKLLLSYVWELENKINNVA